MGAVCSSDEDWAESSQYAVQRRPQVTASSTCGVLNNSIAEMVCPVDEARRLAPLPPRSCTTQDRRKQRLEELMQELFRLHDLNGNGMLEENELVQLNTKIKLLHHGKHADRQAVKDEFRALFRQHLDPDGKPVCYQVFRRYMFRVLDGLDRQLAAQEMIMEHFLEEAKSAHAVFRLPSFASVSDAALLPHFPQHSGAR